MKRTIWRIAFLIAFGIGMGLLLAGQRWPAIAVFGITCAIAIILTADPGPRRRK